MVKFDTHQVQLFVATLQNGFINLPRESSFTVWLTSYLTDLDSAALLLLNQQQIYLFSQIETSQAGGQLYSDTSLYEVSECSLTYPTNFASAVSRSIRLISHQNSCLLIQLESHWRLPTDFCFFSELSCLLLLVINGFQATALDRVVHVKPSPRIRLWFDLINFGNLLVVILGTFSNIGNYWPFYDTAHA